MMIPLGILGSAHNQAAGGAPLEVAYLNYTDSAADLTTYTFSARPIGAADSGRNIIVAFHARAGSDRTVSNITIGGQAATIDHQATASGNTACIAHAAVPSGTTADVVATLSGGAVRAAIGLWTANRAPVVDATGADGSGTVYGDGTWVSALTRSASPSPPIGAITSRYVVLIASEPAGATGGDTTVTGSATETYGGVSGARADVIYN